MSTHWVILDCHGLAHRNFYALGGLQDAGVATGVTYGVLRDVAMLTSLLNPGGLVFCWDSKSSLRAAARPAYKASRRDRPLEEQVARQELYRQVDLLRDDYIPALGYANNLYAEGYEADDLIATAVAAARGCRVTIVSADKDLYQLLAPAVRLYDPTRRAYTTLRDYQTAWQLCPEDWPHVKAIAGCGTDEVAGIEGVGELTAARYINGTLSDKLKSGKLNNKYKAIACPAGQAVWRGNLPLVTLPYPGCPLPRLQPDVTNGAKWRALEKRLGFRDLGWPR